MEIIRAPKTKTRPMIRTSDDEVYLRLNVPSGLESNGKWPLHYGIEQNDDSSAIQHNSNTDDGGVSAKLAAAKSALDSAKNSNVSAKITSPAKRAVVPKPVAGQTTPSGPNLSDELKAKRDNVQAYSDSQD